MSRSETEIMILMGSDLPQKEKKKMARFSVMVVDKSKWLVDKDGGYHEKIERVAEASTEAEAINIFTTAYGGQYEVQVHTLRNIGEYADRGEWWDAEYKIIKEAEEQKKAKAKATREAREKAEAEAMGLTVEEYRTKKNNEAKARKVRKEIEELKKELARKEAYLARLEA
jgi:hypothetical protein